MGRPRRIIHIDRKTKSLWQYVFGVTRGTWSINYELLKPGETVNTKRYQQQLTDLNRYLFEKRLERDNA